MRRQCRARHVNCPPCAAWRDLHKEDVMTRCKLSFAVAGAVSLLALAGPALADVSASASLGNFHITLIDLRPNDGIAPSFTMLADPGRGGLSSAQATIFGPAGSGDTSRLGQSQFDPLSVLRRQEGALARASVTGNGTLAGIGLGSSGAAAGLPTLERSFETLASGGNAAFREGPTLYLLSAHTQLVLTADVSLQAQTTLGTYRSDLVRTEMAGASASLQLNPVDANGGWQYPEGAGDFASVYIPGVLLPGDPFTRPDRQTLFDQLSATITNDGRHSMTATLNAITAAHGSAAVAVVPEPQTYALFLGGLAMIGMVVRRRRRNA
jgi:PEP-CTERM motif